MKPELQARVDGVASTLRGRLGCLICDERGDVWAAHRRDERFVSASVIKVPVLVALAAAVDAGRFRWDEVPALRRECAGGSGVMQYLSALPYTVRDLATLMIIVSDNRATNLIVDLVGMEQINAHLARAGWQGTALRRRMMDADARARGVDNFLTPAETADLFVRLIRRDLVTPGTTAVLLGILKAQQERDRLPARLPEGVEIAHKTGSLPGVMNDAGIIFLPGGPIVAAVFTNDLAAAADGRVAIQEIGRAIVEAGR
ncbi:MAG TPA: serine hydrolase [bacterium]|nr:serine hydrolase [bacterium]